MNPFLDPGWISNALRYWAERLRQVEQMAGELARLRDELRKEGPGC